MNATFLMVCPNGEFGGAERTALNFAAALTERGHWLPHLALLRHGGFERELEAREIPFTVVPDFRLSRPATWRKTIFALRELARATKSRLIHSEMAYGQIVGGSAALAAGLPALWYQHGPIDPWSAQQRIAATIPAAGFLTNSRHSLERQPRLLFPAVREVIPPPLAPEFLTRAANRSLREKLGIAPHETVALLAARFQSKFKGQLLALSAFESIAREHASTRFILLGAPLAAGHRDENDHIAIKAAAARVNRAAGREAVLVLPFDSDVVPYLDAADFIVNASLIPEPFGCTLVEAMARGRAFVAGSAGGVLDIATADTPAFLYAMGSESSLREALRKAFLQHPAEREKLAGRSRERARGFLADGLASRLEQFYARMVN